MPRPRTDGAHVTDPKRLESHVKTLPLCETRNGRIIIGGVIVLTPQGAETLIAELDSLIHPRPQSVTPAKKFQEMSR